MSKDTGGPAFPALAERDAETGEWDTCSQMTGLDVRDYFAAKAMQGWLASYPSTTEADTAIDGVSGIAEFSYAVADAMLAERAK